MLSPECSHFSLGAPLISVEALFKLHDLFASLPLPAVCDRASLQATAPKEAIDEAIGKAMNLPLGNVPPAENPENQLEDLTAALMELLLGLAEQKPGNGGEDEPEAHA